MVDPVDVHAGAALKSTAMGDHDVVDAAQKQRGLQEGWIGDDGDEQLMEPDRAQQFMADPANEYAVQQSVKLDAHVGSEEVQALKDSSTTTSLPASSEVQGELLDANLRTKGFEFAHPVGPAVDAAQQFMADPAKENAAQQYLEFEAHVGRVEAQALNDSSMTSRLPASSEVQGEILDGSPPLRRALGPRIG